MPVKWDATKDRFLFLYLLQDETLNISKSTWDRVITAWPATLGDAPTHRAITEHIGKLKVELNASGVATPKKGKGASNAGTPTPKATTTPKPNKKAATPNKGKKRKAVSSDEDDGHDEQEDDAASGAGSHHDANGTPTMSRVLPGRDAKSPAKRAKVMVAIKTEPDEESEAESDISEFRAEATA